MCLGCNDRHCVMYVSHRCLHIRVSKKYLERVGIHMTFLFVHINTIVGCEIVPELVARKLKRQMHGYSMNKQLQCVAAHRVPASVKEKVFAYVERAGLNVLLNIMGGKLSNRNNTPLFSFAANGKLMIDSIVLRRLDAAGFRLTQARIEHQSYASLVACNQPITFSNNERKDHTDFF